MARSGVVGWCRGGGRLAVALAALALAARAAAADGQPAAGDLTCDGAVDALDLALAARLAAGLPPPAALDGDGDGVVDACADAPRFVDTDADGRHDACDTAAGGAPAAAAAPPRRCGSRAGRACDCPTAPSQCPGGRTDFTFATEMHDIAADACEACGGGAFAMYRDEAQQQAAAAALAAINPPPVPYGGAAAIAWLNGGLNRATTNINEVPNYSGYIGDLDVGTGELLERGFRWDSGDYQASSGDYWEVQGVSGSYDATGERLLPPPASIGGASKEIVLVSWYNQGARGVRVSLVDVGGRRYRHMLLVRPRMNGATATYDGIEGNHAGGIAWVRTGANGGPAHDLLYVPDTSTGVLVFNLSAAFILDTSSTCTSIIGRQSDGKLCGYGYGYAVPEVARYRICDACCCVRFSFLSLDRTTTPHMLATGEYDSNSDAARVMRWPLNARTGMLLADAEPSEDGFEMVRAREPHTVGVSKLQGALVLEGNWYFSTTQSFDEGGLFSLSTHGLGFHAPLDYEGVRMDSGVLPSYPEDLYWDGRGIWTCTEKPSNRYCVQMSLSHLSSHWEA